MNRIDIPSAPVLFYLYADLLVPPARRLGGTEVPCRRSNVKMTALADVIAASALWSLRERGEVALEAAERRRILGSHVEVLVTTQHRGMSDLLGSIAAAADAFGPEVPVEVVIHRWLGRDSALPAMQVIGAAAADARRLGLIDEVPARRGMVGTLLLGATLMKPDCALISALEPSAKEAVQRWQAFVHDERHLADALLRQCRMGIEQRAEPVDPV